jgi:hypothetical protein
MGRSPAPGVSRAVAHVARAACAPGATTDTVVRTDAEPPGEGWLGLPPAPVQVDRRAAGVGGAHRDAVEAGHVDAAAAAACGAHREVRRVAAGLLGPTRGGGRGGGVDRARGVNGVAVGGESGGARGDVLRGSFGACPGRTPLAAPRVAPVACQTFGAGVGGGVAAIVWYGRTRGGGAFAGPQGVDHGHARHTAQVTEHVGQVDVPLGQGLGPVLEAGGRGPHQGLALAPVGPSPTARRGRTAGAVEPPAGVAWWPPRAVGEVGGAAGHMFRVPGVAQVALEARRCQDVAQRAPGHPGAFHDHRLQAARVQPVGHALAVGRTPGTAAHRRWRALWRHGYRMCGAAHGHPSGLEVQGR